MCQCRPKSSEDCPFGPIEDFLEIALKWFLCNYCPLSSFYVCKKIPRTNPEKFYKVEINQEHLVFWYKNPEDRCRYSTQHRTLRTDIYRVRLRPKWPIYPQNNFHRNTKYNIHIILVLLVSTILELLASIILVAKLDPKWPIFSENVSIVAPHCAKFFTKILRADPEL